MNGGKFVIVIGPSASGKSTIVEEVMKSLLSAARLVTTTTRKLRKGEKDGVDYHFLSREEFETRRDKGEFLEWNEFNGHLYGSSRVVIEEMLAVNEVLFAVLDVNGARTALQVFPEAVTIFIRPDSVEQLRERLEKRGATDKEVAWRLDHARDEISQAHDFDHIVINHQDGLQDSVDDILEILQGDTKA